MRAAPMIMIILLSLTHAGLNAITTYTCHDSASKTAVKLVVRQNPADNRFVIDNQIHEFESRGSYLQVVPLFDNLIIQAVSLNDPNVFAHMVLELIRPQGSALITDTVTSIIKINDGSLHEIPLTCLAVVAQD